MTLLIVNDAVITADTMKQEIAWKEYGIAVVGMLPVLIAYPFFQKYFVKGITLGGVKE